MAATYDPKEGTAVRFLIPLATFAALAGLGLAQLDPTVRAETLFLAPLAAMVLSCAAWVASGAQGAGARVLPWAAGLIVAAGWIIPAGATRGTALCLLLIASLLTAVAQHLGDGEDPSFGKTFALALGIQALTRSEFFLAWPDSVIPVLHFLALPAIAAGAMTLLARRHGTLAAWTAGAFVVAVSGGWDLEPTLALAAVASGDLASERWRSKRDRDGISHLGWGDFTPALVLALGAMAYAFSGHLNSPSIALLALPLIAAATVPVKPWAMTGSLMLMLFLSEIGGPPVPWPETFSTVLLVLLLLPAIAMTPLRRWVPVALLALLTARHQEGAPVAAAALAALAIFSSRWTGKGRGMTSAWIGAWLAAALLAASYPWLRGDPLETFLSGVGLGTTGPRLGWIAAFLAMAWATSFLAWIWTARQRLAGPRILEVASILGLLAITTALAQQPASDSLLLGEPVTLTQERFRWTQALDEVEAGRLVLKTNLAFAAQLPPGQPVAAVRLHHPDGSFTQRLVRAGRDTAEWAARRPDVLQTLTAPPPDAWSSQVAAQGGFFAQRYHGSWELEGSAPVTRISVLRRRDLPPDVRLTLFRVELNP